MFYLILISVLLLISFYIQYILSKHAMVWQSILLMTLVFIPTVIFLFMNYSDAFVDVEGFGDFLLNYGTDGVIALILKTGLLLLPTCIHIVIFFYMKNKNKDTEKQLDKMIASDM